MAEEKGQSSVSIDPEGMLVVAVNLKQPNAEIIALGLLEKAKSASQAWIYQHVHSMNQAVNVAAKKEKSVIDRLIRRNGN